MTSPIQLGINIDHVATVRQARRALRATGTVRLTVSGAGPIEIVELGQLQTAPGWASLTGALVSPLPA